MLNKDTAVWNSYQIPGMMWPQELMWIYDTFKSSASHLEIGTYCGKSTYVTANAMNRGNLITIDNCSDDGIFNSDWVAGVRTCTFNEIRKTKCHLKFLQKNSIDAARDPITFTAYDSIFIDGDHSYASCKADIECWLPRLKSGGIISGHDYWPKHEGVMDAVHESFNSKFEVVPNTRIWYARYSV